jgi:hypothetical protein
VCPKESLATFEQELSNQMGFLSDNALAELIQEHFVDKKIALALYRAILFLRPYEADFVGEALDAWRDSRADGRHALDDALLAAIKDRLPFFTKPYAAIDRFQKAQRLSTITGKHLRDVKVICDARPIFNVDRDDIDGFTLLTTLQLNYFREDGDFDCFEVILMPAELAELAEQIESAQNKLAVMKSRLGDIAPQGIVDCWNNL